MAGYSHPMEEKMTISGPAGPLEAVLTMPENADGSRFAVVCHPHPLFSGTMNNKVVTTLVRTFRDLGMPVVRFNFRGVGESAGQFNEGRDETEDLLAVLKWCQAKWPEARAWQAGFSFGSYVAYRASQSYDFEQLLIVAPPVHRGHFDGLPRPNCPMLVVQGEADEVVPPDDVFAWLDTLSPAPDIIRMPDTSHFFHGKLVELKELLTQHYAAKP